MASTWIVRRPRKSGGVNYRVMFRVGGRESSPRYAGSFATMREAKIRRDWVAGELAAMRAPDLAALAEPEAAPTFRESARLWQASRTDVRASTVIQHTTALNRAYGIVGDLARDAIDWTDVQRMVDELAGAGLARESIRKTKTAAAMVLDHFGVTPNPARDRRVRLPLEEPDEVEPPIADHVEAVAWRLPIDYMLGVLVLDATGCRIGELAAAKIADLDEDRRAWLVRARVAKTRRARWVELPDDLFDVVLDRLPAREDRDLEAPLIPIGSTDRLRVAIDRACRDAGVPDWSPHDLRHRRISLLHRAGMTWAEIGAQVGQRNLSVTADRYTRVLLDPRGVDRAKLLSRVRTVQTPVHTSEAETASFAAAS
jgi:integrase